MYELLIIFKDSTTQTIPDVCRHGINRSNVFYFETSDSIGFLPKENIRFFGKETDWDVSYDNR